MADGDRLSDQTHRLKNSLEIGPTLAGGVKITGSAIGRVVTASVDDPGSAINEPGIPKTHAVVNPLDKFFLVGPLVLGVGLDGVEPVEEPGDPLELRRRGGVTDQVRVLAEIQVRVEHIAVGLGTLLAEVKGELTIVTGTGGLDSSASPPAAAFDVSSRAFAKERSVGAGTGLVAVHAAVIPTA